MMCSATRGASGAVTAGSTTDISLKNDLRAAKVKQHGRVGRLSDGKRIPDNLEHEDSTAPITQRDMGVKKMTPPWDLMEKDAHGVRRIAAVLQSWCSLDYDLSLEILSWCFVLLYCTGNVLLNILRILVESHSRAAAYLGAVACIVGFNLTFTLVWGLRIIARVFETNVDILTACLEATASPQALLQLPSRLFRDTKRNLSSLVAYPNDVILPDLGVPEAAHADSFTTTTTVGMMGIVYPYLSDGAADMLRQPLQFAWVPISPVSLDESQSPTRVAFLPLLRRAYYQFIVFVELFIAELNILSAQSLRILKPCRREDGTSRRGRLQVGVYRNQNINRRRAQGFRTAVETTSPRASMRTPSTSDRPVRGTSTDGYDATQDELFEDESNMGEMEAVVESPRIGESIRQASEQPSQTPSNFLTRIVSHAFTIRAGTPSLTKSASIANVVDGLITPVTTFARHNSAVAAFASLLQKSETRVTEVFGTLHEDSLADAGSAQNTHPNTAPFSSWLPPIISRVLFRIWSLVPKCMQRRIGRSLDIAAKRLAARGNDRSFSSLLIVLFLLLSGLILNTDAAAREEHASAEKTTAQVPSSLKGTADLQSPNTPQRDVLPKSGASVTGADTKSTLAPASS